MGSEYEILFSNKDSRGFSITVEDLSITTIQQAVREMLELAEPAVAKISDKIELMPMPGVIFLNFLRTFFIILLRASCFKGVRTSHPST